MEDLLHHIEDTVKTVIDQSDLKEVFLGKEYSITLNNTYTTAPSLDYGAFLRVNEMKFLQKEEVMARFAEFIGFDDKCRYRQPYPALPLMVICHDVHINADKDNEWLKKNKVIMDDVNQDEDDQDSEDDDTDDLNNDVNDQDHSSK